MSALLVFRPQIVLYALLACTYALAAMLSWRKGHVALARCYLVISILHLLIAACNLIHPE